VVVISSSEERVADAVSRLNHANVEGRAGDVRDEAAFTTLLKELAPLDHIVFSGVDKIIRGPLAEADLGQAKHLFGVKFWGSVVVGKGNKRLAKEGEKKYKAQSCTFTILTLFPRSARKV